MSVRTILIAAIATSCGCSGGPEGQSPTPEQPIEPVVAPAPEPVAAEPPAPPAPSIDDPSTWLVAESHDLGFRVRMPPYDDSLPLDGHTSLSVYSRAEGMRGPWFLIAVAPTGVPARMLRNDRGVENVLRQRIRQHVGYDPLGRPDYLGGGPLTTMYGHQAYAETDIINGFDGSMQGTIWTRAVLVGERIYVLQVREHGGRPSTDVRDAFFNSFELTAPPSTEAAP